MSWLEVGCMIDVDYIRHASVGTLFAAEELSSPE